MNSDIADEVVIGKRILREDALGISGELGEPLSCCFSRFGLI